MDRCINPVMHRLQYTLKLVKITIKQHLALISHALVVQSLQHYGTCLVTSASTYRLKVVTLMNTKVTSTVKFTVKYIQSFPEMEYFHTMKEYDSSYAVITNEFG